MCSDTNSNLDSIQDFVLNQDKIVTYRWLSKELNIHVNTSKQLLHTFAKKEKDDKILVTYLVSGSTKDGFKVVVVPQQDLDKVKFSLDTVLSEHVYSVQKATSALSSSDLYLAETSAPESSNTLSSISPREVEERQLKLIPVAKPSAPIASAPISTIKPQEKVTSSASSKKPSLFYSRAPEKKEKEKTSEQTKEKEAKENAPAAKSPAKTLVLSPTKSHKKKLAHVKAGDIGAMFSKQAEKKKTEPAPRKNTEEIKSPVKPEETKEDDQMDVDEEIPAAILENKSPQKTVDKTPSVNRKKQTKPRNKKRKSDNSASDNTPARKRKRIVLASDSESEENDEEDDGYVEEGPDSPEQPPPPVAIESDEEEVIPPTPLGEKTKPRIRKQIDKTYIDDEGYVITKKEFVYVSASEDEAKDEQDKTKPAPLDKQPEKVSETKSSGIEEQSHKETKTKGKSDKKSAKGKTKSPKKTPPKANKNQASIMNFFKKM